MPLPASIPPHAAFPKPGGDGSGTGPPIGKYGRDVPTSVSFPGTNKASHEPSGGWRTTHGVE
eukprot:CAMPEP_0171595460 /NCGR_PEP_ID=MMETSP0990-20121206/1343_1 /TAXON_ID=483369 /ORGANISM="non described non described, Strain CCMP2098" /LENGTH=61 /DNA_ID=CAMNT_0012156435 /DNA_START=715 /DNA_END=900 /DNA_ORIENTATION=+